MSINLTELKQQLQDVWDDPEQRAKLIQHGLLVLGSVGSGLTAALAKPPVTWRQRKSWMKNLDLGTGVIRVAWHPINSGLDVTGGWLITTANDAIRRKVGSAAGRFVLVTTLSLGARVALAAGTTWIKQQPQLQKLDQYGLAGWVSRKMDQKAAA